MRIRRLVIGIAAVMCLSGCTSSSDDPPKAKPTPITITADDASAMKEGRDYDVVATLPGKIQGVEPRYVGVAPDGIVYGRVYIEGPDAEEPKAIGGNALTGHSDVFLLDPRSGKITEVLDGAIRRKPMGVTGMDADDDWVVWLESPDGGFGSGSWKLYSYERGTEKIREIGSYADDVVVPKAELDYERRPEISGDQVVMATSHWKDKTGSKSQVLTVPLDGSAPMTEVARGATSVDADVGGISYFTKDGVLTFRDAVSGETSVVDDSDSGCRGVRSGVLVTCDPYGSGTKVRVRAKGGTTTTYGPFDGDIGYTYFEPGWVRFVSGTDDKSSLWVIDVDDAKLFKLGDTQGGWDLMGHDMALVFNPGKRDFTLIKLR